MKLKLKSLVVQELVANDYVITWPDRHRDLKSHRTSTKAEEQGEEGEGS